VPTKPHTHTHLRWLWPAALSVIATGGIAWWCAHSDPERILALAYTGRRGLDLRIPFASYAPLVQRIAEQPAPALLTAEAAILRACRSHPENSRWRRLRARAALLRGDFDAALDELEEMREQGAEVMPDLALAYAARAEARTRPLDYAQALEELARELRRQPRNPELLFNMAVVLSKLHLPFDARLAWEQYLHVDGAGGWAGEARQRLEEVNRQLQLPQSTGGDDDETLLASADYRSLPQGQAAAIAQRHRDTLLRDLLAHAPGPHSLADLASAHRENAAGNPDAAVRLAQTAREQFARARNQPGAARAGFELVYALHRASKPCRREAEELLAAVHGRHFAWLEAQTLLEAASCSNMMGDFERARLFASRAAKLAEASRYPVLSLRAAGILAAINTTMGRTAEAWEIDQGGLTTFWSGKFPPDRAYQFYNDLSTGAERLGYAETVHRLLRQAVAMIGHTNFKSVEGLERQKLARAAMLCGNYEEAVAEAKRSSELFADLPQTPAIRLYRINGEIGLLAIEAEHGQVSQALERLLAMQERMADYSNQVAALRYYRTLAEVERKAGRLEESNRTLGTVIRTAEQGLTLIATDADRLAWSAVTAEAYRLRVQNEIDSGRVERALEIWEWLAPPSFVTGPRARMPARIPGIQNAVWKYAVSPRRSVAKP
jgi:tetratricopeptide (TPR) repeat protein